MSIFAVFRFMPGEVGRCRARYSTNRAKILIVTPASGWLSPSGRSRRGAERQNKGAERGERPQ
jgi:hypothetical protein